jgi:hypothetical protein
MTMNTIDVLKDMLKKRIRWQTTDGWGDQIETSSEIAALTKAIEQLEWVPVSEPPKEKSVLCYWTDGAIETFDSEDIGEWNKKHGANHQITHWKLLPIKPMEDGE